METKRIYRSKSDRKIAGVCGGLAAYLNVDPTIVRLVAVLLALAGSFGFWAYVIAAIVIPEEPETPVNGGYTPYEDVGEQNN